VSSKKRNKDIIAGLDIGETKVVCAIGKLNASNDTVDILGIAQAESNGLKNGIIIDIESLSDAIASAVEDAEDQAECRVSSVITNLSGKDVMGISSRGSVVVSNGKTQVRERDVERALKEAENIALPLDRDVLHKFIDNFTVDTQAGIKNPVGLYGSRLLTSVYFITALYKHIRNMARTINQAGFEVEDLMLSNLANAQSVLTGNEQNKDFMLLDIGASSSSVSLFHDEKIKWHDVITMGGDYLTESISDFFKISADEAEDIKIRYGQTGTSHHKENIEKITFSHGKVEMVISRSELIHLLDLRLHQLFNSIIGRMERAGHRLTKEPFLVITGQSAQMDGLLESAEEFFGVPVRLGYTRGLGRSVGNVADPAYTTAIGIVKYAAKEKMAKKIDLSGHGILSKILLKSRQFLSEYF